ncbi:hypothetical protein [Parenemella sanctibonifatiensis]|uniref:Lipoprotein n=1 Tax=Parenemella sanctibonifatiensis TaxID=2016505 RepID=A0A255EKX2_9ACTN|nr:hypothetical protein [Parenemella sanctibonifatiensis]OYN92179.1 hypothetical protein CGZ91_01320 [Parenemella sanctibonifatiensis]
MADLMMARWFAAVAAAACILVTGCGGGAAAAPARIEGLCPTDDAAYNNETGGPRQEIPDGFEIEAVTWCSRPVPDNPLIERFTTEVEPLVELIEEIPTTPPPTVTRNGAVLACGSQPGNREIVYLYPAEGEPIFWAVPVDDACGSPRDRHDVYEVLEHDMTWTWTGDPVQVP